MTDANTEGKKKRIEEAEELYKKGLDFGQKSDADGAIECWKKTIELNPEHFEAWYNLGNAYDLGKEDLERALECWNKALEIKTDDIDVLYNMGNAYREHKDYDLAIECYKR